MVFIFTDGYRIAGNFRRVKIFAVEQYLVSLWLRLLLALQVKVGKVASFVGKIFVLQCSTTTIRYMLTIVGITSQLVNIRKESTNPLDYGCSLVKSELF